MVTSTAQRITESDIVATIRETDPGMTVETIGAPRRGGVSTTEVIVNTESIPNMIRDVSESLATDEVTIGARTVLDAEMVQTATLAGAEFTVAPSFDESVIETANRYGVPSLAGIATPTEAVNAFEAGADMVKVFPVGMLGPRFISALSDPLGHIPAVPAGGVGLGNVDGFFDVGVTAISVGSPIVDTETTTYGGFDIIEVNARVFRGAVEAARSG